MSTDPRVDAVETRWSELTRCATCDHDRWVHGGAGEPGCTENWRYGFGSMSGQLVRGDGACDCGGWAE